jgi:hypothetical protein
MEMYKKVGKYIFALLNYFHHKKEYHGAVGDIHVNPEMS